MPQPKSTMVEEVTRAAAHFQQQLTGHAPREITVVLSNDILVITLQGALTEAERALAENPDGAEKVQEFHRQLFASGAEPLRAEIKRITGATVRDAAVEFASGDGPVVCAFATGTMVQVFQLDKKPNKNLRTKATTPIPPDSVSTILPEQDSSRGTET